MAANVETHATTSANGLYGIIFLLPGAYKVTAEATGFKTAVREHIALQVNERRTVDIALQLGEVKESVTVSGEAPLLTPESASPGQVISNRTILELPLNVRNPLTR